ncbi:hypothetical protein DFH11DRAFT_1731488 [Phellopilus nigrolimitatus]|nr:hypothetical protein DFH11DRAFT_1731488 [Phellopilus nigrolimitatus]
MPVPTWAGDHEGAEDLLLEEDDNYLKAKKSNTVTAFFDQFFDTFLERYPPTSMLFPRVKFQGSEEKIQIEKTERAKERIRQWYYNKHRVRRTQTVLNLSGKVQAKEEKNESSGPKRMYQMHEAYEKLVIEKDPERSALLESLYFAYKKSVPEGTPAKTKKIFKSGVLKEWLKSETDAVRDNVTAFRKATSPKLRAEPAETESPEGQVSLTGESEGCESNITIEGRSVPITENNGHLEEMDALVKSSEITDDPVCIQDEEVKREENRRLENMELQKRIDKLPPTMSTFAKELRGQINASGIIILGFPQPDKGGKIKIFTTSFGKTADTGKSFEQYYPNFKNAIQVPATQWLSKCFTKAIRDSIALDPAVGSSSSSTSASRAVSAIPENPSRRATAGIEPVEEDAVLFDVNDIAINSGRDALAHGDLEQPATRGFASKRLDRGRDDDEDEEDRDKEDKDKSDEDEDEDEDNDEDDGSRERSDQPARKRRASLRTKKSGL